MKTVQPLGSPWRALPLAAGLLLMSAQAMAESPRPIPPDAMIKPRPTACETAQVLRVIDGDTLVVAGTQGTEKVRISQIAAPATSQHFGKDAALCLHTLAANRTVSMCRDGRDRHGITLANLTVGSNDAATYLVERGCARAYEMYLESGSPLPSLQDSAMAADRGMWGLLPTTLDRSAPWVYRASSVPVPILENGQPAVNVAVGTTATPTNRLLDWAEFRFDELLLNGSFTVAVGTSGGGYRCYNGGICVGVLDGAVVFHDGQQMHPLGTEADLLRAAQADGY